MFVLDAFLLVLGFLAVNVLGIREAKDEEFPFQVSVKTPSNRYLCGGAIITPLWVLTVSDCVEKYPAVRVSYGSADAVIPIGTIDSSKVILQNEINLKKKNRLALIQLQDSIKFSKTAAQARLPTPKAQLINTTKLSGWDLKTTIELPPRLYVTERYLVIPKDCRSPTSNFPISLNIDEFCGMDEEQQNFLSSPGMIVSKAGIALGIMPRRPLATSEPYIFVKLSEHDQWIKDVLSSDAEFISWADSVPKDSGHGLRAMSFGLLTALVVCLFCL